MPEAHVIQRCSRRRADGVWIVAMEPVELARACAAKMWEVDQTRRSFGMTLDAVGPGFASVSMQVRPDMLNNHGACHGGTIFTLADSAFAYACNSYDAVTVAQHCSITFLVAGKVGDTLTAKAREAQRTGRSGVYDITVTRQDGVAIAEFRGLSRTTGGSFLAQRGG